MWKREYRGERILSRLSKKGLKTKLHCFGVIFINQKRLCISFDTFRYRPRLEIPNFPLKRLKTLISFKVKRTNAEMTNLWHRSNVSAQQLSPRFHDRSERARSGFLVKAFVDRRGVSRGETKRGKESRGGDSPNSCVGASLRWTKNSRRMADARACLDWRECTLSIASGEKENGAGMVEGGWVGGIMRRHPPAW